MKLPAFHASSVALFFFGHSGTHLHGLHAPPLWLMHQDRFFKVLSPAGSRTLSQLRTEFTRSGDYTAAPYVLQRGNNKKSISIVNELLSQTKACAPSRTATSGRLRNRGWTKATGYTAAFLQRTDLGQ